MRAPPPKLYTIDLCVEGKGREVRRNLTGTQVDAVRKMLRSVKCTHAGPCRFPFKQCDAGYIMVVTEE